MPLVAAIVVWLLVGAGCRAGTRFPGCNIVLISIDTLRADHVGVYGYPRDTTPNIDRFARECVVFDEAAANAPKTLPSHASIFTSLLPSHHGVLSNRGYRVPDDAVMMAEILRDQGYRTISFNDGGLVAAEFGFSQGFELYDSTPRKSRFSTRVEPAMEWIAANRESRFFLFLHTYEVHLPLEPPKVYFDLFSRDDTRRLPGDLAFDAKKRNKLKKAGFAESDVEHAIDLYDATIRSMDASFQDLVDFLSTMELLDNTLVIFTSDHGEEYGERGRLAAHGSTLYDEVIRVPLIIRFPGGRFGSRHVDRQVSGIDILPTVLDIAGIEPLEVFEGRSLTDLIRGRRSKTNIAFSETGSGKLAAARDGTWKLLHSIRGDMLFQLLDDPDETHNVAAGNPETLRRLQQNLDEALGARPMRSHRFDHDEATIERLRALGYVD
jgi:arylsulfatase A-like enzyme